MTISGNNRIIPFASSPIKRSDDKLTFYCKETFCLSFRGRETKRNSRQHTLRKAYTGKFIADRKIYRTLPTEKYVDKALKRLNKNN